VHYPRQIQDRRRLPRGLTETRQRRVEPSQDVRHDRPRWDAERWTIPAAKMKAGWDHVVPLFRQALAILRNGRI
jgi:hypothetical protein